MNFCYFFEKGVKEFDLNRKPEFLDKELDQLFPESANNRRYVDKLIKVYTLAGIEEWILVHVEVQGYRDMDFARRMYIYYYRIMEKYNRPIAALAIYTDEDRKYHPKNIKRNI